MKGDNEQNAERHQALSHLLPPPSCFLGSVEILELGGVTAYSETVTYDEETLRFTRLCMDLASRQAPPYSSKFSKHTFLTPSIA
jgi:hypothetical protein